MTDSYFGNNAVVTEKLVNWMQWASGRADAKRHVVLPMIQRGSVWAPHKLLDLWDTLLRGMPLGAMMASETVGDSIRVLVEGSTRQADAGDIGLIDGQQRTLSMLAGWPQGLINPLRPVAIWVDLTDTAQGEYQFRLWATTKAQPFGYARASMGGQPLSKLERHKLRLANEVWGKVDVQALWKQADFMPWEAKFAVPLTELIDNKATLHAFLVERRLRYKAALEAALEAKASSTLDPEHELSKHFGRKLAALPSDVALAERIPGIEAALNMVAECEFPVIRVRRECFNDKAVISPNDNIDPPLAILFKRVGTGGEPLSNADYVYSVIKHYAPDVHNTVNGLLEDGKIRAIYTPTTLVMSAARLTILSLKAEDGEGRKLTDSAKLDKATFARLVRNHPEFIAKFHADIKPDGVFATRLKQVLNSISYSTDFPIGLPKHALCLVQIPLLETILAWHTLRTPSADELAQSRLPLVRFVLQGNLCVLDYAKASEVANKALKENPDAASKIFPDHALMNVLSAGEKPSACPLPSPSTLSAIDGLTESPTDTTGLRGWTRFAVKEDANKPHAEIYKRWWNRKGGHVHPMLLWLQRDYIFDKFEEQPALAGMDEETPFDFDHILPSAQWAYWTGAGGGDRFIDFPLKDKNGSILDKSGHWNIGNSIGNIHVLESSANRQLGDTSAHVKLTTGKFAINAQILTPNMEAWQTASGDEDKPRRWDKERALAFQRAVEQRTFALYSKFYEVLNGKLAAI